MAKKTHLKVRMVPESNPNSKFIYYAKKPTKGEKAKGAQAKVEQTAEGEGSTTAQAQANSTWPTRRHGGHGPC